MISDFFGTGISHLSMFASIPFPQEMNINDNPYLLKLFVKKSFIADHRLLSKHINVDAPYLFLENQEG